MKEEQETAIAVVLGLIFGGVGATLIAVVVGTPLLLLQGWVLQTLWHWFAMPFGLPFLRLPFAIGLIILVRFIIPSTSIADLMTEEQRRANIVPNLVRGVLGPLIDLGLGWLVHHFV